MSKDKKPSTDELYAQRQWNDNMAFSSKAIDESKKKTGHLDAQPAPKVPSAPGTQPLTKYVNEMNQEINRMSNAVGNRIDHMGKGLSKSFSRLVRPIGKSVNEVADSATEGFKSMSTGIGKAMIQEFTSVIRNLGDKVSPEEAQATGAPAVEAPETASDLPPQPPPSSSFGAASLGGAALGAAAQSSQAALPEKEIPSFDYHFGKLLEHKIFFATIHNRPFLTERDIERFEPDDPGLMYEWMQRGVEEIRNCAPYGQKLPMPKKGLYMNIPMYDILRQVGHDDLEKFLRFVYNRPQPFQQKALKLSEAFATWAHKGAPER